MTHGSELPASAPCGARRTVPAGLLRVAVSQARPGVLVVSPVGEMDAGTADVLRDAARDAVASTPRCVVVDLAGLTFCGSTGLVVLLDACRRAEAAGVRFSTVDGPRIVRRVLEITQLGPVLGHRETLDDVLCELDA
ncbi:STAS domain-containing protein [Pseudonocardia sichuanensis]|uniref:Anti-sigma factor antagonist n=1 Tax=Pseudonocardia kunmingensis TaxID=630975 RepID=A0A543D1F4_9PSEU|nr:STAS domain-containing protein [Pseudonocardia kunmingensis]TQM03132.1 stage II sporulation protein AA (anti-sigma F factor antagonist) [Pseudonocardia kunmingensis]